MTIALTCLLVGCKDPVVGKWEAEVETACLLGGTDRLEFEIEPDLTGEGDVCGCDFDLVVTNKGDGEYEAEVDYDANCLLGDVEVDCEISSSGDDLDCENVGEFDRAD